MVYQKLIIFPDYFTLKRNKLKSYCLHPHSRAPVQDSKNHLIGNGVDYLNLFCLSSEMLRSTTEQKAKLVL
jgi:hypothetical protein